MARRTPTIDIQLLNHPISFKEFSNQPFEAGGECIFLGRTRLETHAHHGRLTRLSYEAYVPMTKSVLQALAEQAVERYDCIAVRIHHALGEVPPGESSVLVQVLCRHRAEAFDACRFLIDRLKAEAPIWKREVWEDGSTWSTGQPAQFHESP